MIDRTFKELADGPNFAVLTTLFPNGHPQSHVMWVGCDEDHILINTEIHRQKFKNVSRDPRVTVTVWDHTNPYRFAEVRGRVVETVGGQAARDHIDALSQKYGGRPYPDKAIQTERIILKISPERQVSRG